MTTPAASGWRCGWGCTAWKMPRGTFRRQDLIRHLFAAAEASFRWLLQKFVDPAWIDARRFKTNLTADDADNARINKNDVNWHIRAYPRKSAVLFLDSRR